MDWLVNSLNDFCRTQGFDNTYWVAYSGGLDSHVLLHLLAQLRQAYPLMKLTAVHINHNLSTNAVLWERHCATVCRELNITYLTRAIPLSETLQNVEEVVRDARYALLMALLSPQDVLLTAHHQNDQAETVLLQLLRGAGPKGLAAMPRLKTFGPGWHARPLLPFSRADLQHYAAQHQLHWIEDESNNNTHFTRNFLRHEVLPLLKKRWPSVNQTLARAAENCAEAEQLLKEVAEQELPHITGSLPHTLSINQLRSRDVIRQRFLIRAWLAKYRFPIPPAVKLQQIQRDMLHARQDKSPHFIWRGMILRRYRDDLYAMSYEEHDSTICYTWNLAQSLSIPTVGRLQAHIKEGVGCRTDIDQVSVRFRQGGEVIQLPGRMQRHSVKNLFQEWGIPPWERERIPLLYVGEKLAMVVGYAVDAEFVVGEKQPGYDIRIGL